MRRTISVCIVLMALLYVSPPVEAQSARVTMPVNLRFEHITIENGLSQNTILDTLQDRHGYLWFATQDGLNRYDGFTFTVFRSRPGEPGSLGSSNILALVEDAQGMLWIGTMGGGLNRMDPRTGAVTVYRHSDADLTTLSHDTVTDLLAGSDGSLWVATLGGLDRMNPDGTFRHYRHDPRDSGSLSANNISVLLEDSAGFLWIGTGYITYGHGLNRLDPASGKITRYANNPHDESSLSSNNIASLFEDRDGVLWVGTGGRDLKGAGLNRLNPDGTFRHFQHEARRPGSLAGDSVMTILQDQNGVIWLGLDGGGLDLFDPYAALPVFFHSRNDPYNANSLSSDRVSDLFSDRSGVIWISTYNGGLNKFKPNTTNFHLNQHSPSDPRSLSANVVSEFYQDEFGQVWVATLGGGLEYYSEGDNYFVHYRHDPNDPFSIVSDNVTTIYGDKKSGLIWVGTTGGLNWFDRYAGKFRRILHEPRNPDTIISNSITYITGDPSGMIWIATREGLDQYNHETGKFRHFIHEIGNARSLSSNICETLFVDRDGALWVGTRGGGLNRLNPDESFTRYQYDARDPGSLSDNTVYAIQQDRRGQIWVGTQQGLNRLNEDGSFTQFHVRDGLPSENIKAILEDESGNLWISTASGLARYHPETRSIKVFDVDDGLQGNEFMANAALKDIYGRLYFGGVNGFNWFLPSFIADNPVPPPVVVTQFLVDNQPVQADLSGAAPLEMQYWQRVLAFEFVALDFHDPERNQFAYKLEGFDDDWTYSGSRRYQSYSNLPGGNYVFKVRAANGDGYWNEQGVSIPIRVVPPFWQALWFRSAIVLLLAGLTLGVYTLRVRSIQTQKQRLEMQVAQRTEQLRREIEQRRQTEAVLAQKAAEEAVAAERTRLARDLHDAVTQTLFSASLIAEILPEIWSTDKNEAFKSVDELRRLTRGALAEMRTLLLELRPASLTQARLEDLLRQLTEALIGRARLPVALSVEGERKLPPEVQVAIYRIAQECLNNAAKYSRATRVNVSLLLSPLGAHLEISDNGIGFDIEAVRSTSLGLRIMRERAESVGAEFQVSSQVGQGTTLSLTWSESLTTVAESIAVVRAED